MPKLIDHEARAVAVTEAAWRVLVRDGVGAVSVRNVAQEAGIATASLRRAFPRQADLLNACLELMSERVAARIDALTETAPLPLAMAALRETLPLDEERRTEMEVYLALGTLSWSDPALQPTFAKVQGGLDELTGAVVDGLSPDLAEPMRERETAHLGALIDGLALRILHGGNPDAALEVLRSHLERMMER